MARSQPKPLPIRGDRLLLALRVMYSCSQNDRHGFSSAKTRATLARAVSNVDGGEMAECTLGNWYCDKHQGSFLYSIVFSNMSVLAQTVINVASLTAVEPGESREIPRILRRFLKLIASGELTEKDFRA